MINVLRFHSMAEAKPFHDAINHLNLRSHQPDAFSTFEFYDSIASTLPASSSPTSPQLWLLLAFDAGQLVGCLALKRCTHRVMGFSAAKLDLLTAYRADRPHLVCHVARTSDVSDAMYTYLIEHRSEWSLLQFDQQDPQSAVWGPSPVICARCEVMRWPNMASSRIAIRWPTVGLYFADLSRKFRSNVSRQMRTLLAAGEVELVSGSDPATLVPLFDLYCSIEANSWKSRSETAFSSDRGCIAYYQALMAADQPMSITIEILLLDKVPVAGLITGAFGHDLNALHIVYDERFAKLAPGSAILLMGIHRAIERGFVHLNLMHGFGYYKTRWLAEMSETQGLQFYRIGSPFYWRRKLGNVKRRWMGPPASDKEPDFNQARRDTDIPSPIANAMTPPPVEAPEIARHHRRLIARLRTLPATFIDARQIAAILPFETRKPGGPAPAEPQPLSSWKLDRLLHPLP